MADRSGDSFVSYIALILSIIAIILAWSAYRSSNENGLRLETMDTQMTEQRVQWLALEAQEEVGELGQNIDNSIEFNPDAISTRVAELRNNLQGRFEEEDGESSVEWQKLDIQLSQLQQQLSEGTINTIETLQTALARIQQEVGN